mgnify:FL=1|jgi:hypothetical protein
MYKYKISSTKNINFDSLIFREYPDKKYLQSLHRLNRPAVCIYDESYSELLIGCAVLSKRSRALKICLLVVLDNYRHRHFGSSLMKYIIDFVNDDFSDVDYCYAVCPRNVDTNNYEGFLLKHGFYVSTIKANGDVIYTYAGSI